VRTAALADRNCRLPNATRLRGIDWAGYDFENDPSVQYLKNNGVSIKITPSYEGIDFSKIFGQDAPANGSTNGANGDASNPFDPGVKFDSSIPLQLELNADYGQAVQEEDNRVIIKFTGRYQF
jgi:hypothetical protein